MVSMQGPVLQYNINFRIRPLPEVLFWYYIHDQFIDSVNMTTEHFEGLHEFNMDSVILLHKSISLPRFHRAL